MLPWLPAPCIIVPAAGSTIRFPSPGKDDGNPLGTEISSSTVTVESDYFIASGVMFRNDPVGDEVV